MGLQCDSGRYGGIHLLLDRLALFFKNSLIEYLDIQVITDRIKMSVLLGTEDIARTDGRKLIRVTDENEPCAVFYGTSPKLL